MIIYVMSQGSMPQEYSFTSSVSWAEAFKTINKDLRLDSDKISAKLLQKDGVKVNMGLSLKDGEISNLEGERLIISIAQKRIKSALKKYQLTEAKIQSMSYMDLKRFLKEVRGWASGKQPNLLSLIPGSYTRSTTAQLREMAMSVSNYLSQGKTVKREKAKSSNTPNPEVKSQEASSTSIADTQFKDEVRSRLLEIEKRLSIVNKWNFKEILK